MDLSSDAIGVLLGRYQVGIPRRQSARWSASGASGMSAATDEDKNNIEGTGTRGDERRR